MNISELEKSITNERFRNSALKFRDKKSKNIVFYQFTKKDLYDSYLFNERLSKEIRFTLAQFEVILRNQVDSAIVAGWGVNWLKGGVINFGTKELATIQEAESRIIQNRKTVTHARLVAKLSFSFWVRMFTSPYNFYTSAQKSLIFPRNNSKVIKSPLSMNEIRTMLESSNKIRNKVSHQEFILDSKYEIKKVHSNCLILMNLMNKDYYANFTAYDNFEKEFAFFEKHRSSFLASKGEFADFE